MTKHALLLIISICSFYISSAQYTWTQMANIGVQNRANGFSFTIAGKGYTGTGTDSVYHLFQDFWAYDTLSNTWTQEADFGGGTAFNAAAFSIGNKGYAGLGSSAYPSYIWTTGWWEYDPATNIWTQKGNFPGLGRYTAISFSIGKRGYMGTGWDGGLFSDFYQYDPINDTWTAMTNFGGGIRQSTVSIVIGNRAYAGAGAVGSNIYQDWWEFDPVANTWTQKADIPSIRNNAAGFTIDGYGFVGLGSITYPQLTFLKDFYRYDPVNDVWTQISDFAGSARYSVVTFSFPGSCSGYVCTGEYGPNYPRTVINDLWRFTVDSCVATIATLPVASFTTNDSALCVNDRITFTDLSTNATSWQWSFPGGTPSSSTQENPYVCYLSAGTYDVTLVAANSSGQDSVTFSNYINVKTAPPTPLITPIGTTLYCSTDSSYVSYQWYDSTTIIPGATDTTLVITDGGNYNVQVTNSNGCSIAVGINVVLGLNTWDKDNSISIFPNPMSSSAVLQLNNNRQDAEVVIYDVVGKEIMRKRITGNRMLLEKGGLQSGIYYVRVLVNEKQYVQKIAVE